MKLTVDTNVVLRYLLDDDENQGAVARKAMQTATRIVIPLPVLCETVWTLSRGYKMNNIDIANALKLLIGAETVKVDRPAVDAGLQMLQTGGDFADGATAYNGHSLGGEVFTSFDKKAITRLKNLGIIKTRLLS